MISANRRLAINTVSICCRIGITAVVSLFATRYLISAIGEEDFGLYNLIGGVVALFLFISTTMTVTTQRFLSYHMGSGDITTEQLTGIFKSAILVQTIIAIVIAIIVQAGGTYLINNVLNIPQESISDARFLLITVTLGVIATIIAVPFEAALLAHEKIAFISVLQISYALIRFAGILLLLDSSGNRLRLYSIIMAALSYLILIAQFIVCQCKFQETKLNNFRYVKMYSLKSIGGFASWIFCGITCSTIRSYLGAMFMNIFYGVIINAANGIAVQVNTLVEQYSASITTSIRPQLMKSAGSRDKFRFNTLLFLSCRIPLILSVIAIIPIYISLPDLLNIWLTEIPPYTITFCRIILLTSLFSQATIGLASGLEAIGKIKIIHLSVGIIKLLALPFGWYFLKCGFPPQSMLLCIFASEIISSIIRVTVSHYYISYSLKAFLMTTILRPTLICVLAYPLLSYIWEISKHSVLNTIAFLIFSIILVCGITFFVALKKDEKDRIIRKTKSAVNQIKEYV